MKNVITWLKERWLGTFLSGLILFFLRVYYELPDSEKKDFWTFGWIWSILKTKVDLWLCLLLVVFTIIMFIVRNLKKSSRQELEEEVFTYKTDSFGPIFSSWKWEYDYNKELGKLKIIEVKPLCPNCESPGKLGEDPTNPNLVICPRCRLEQKINFTFEISQYAADVSIEIERRIRTGDWRIALKKKK